VLASLGSGPPGRTADSNPAQTRREDDKR
jgi:hypothetical protein